MSVGPESSPESSLSTAAGPLLAPGIRQAPGVLQVLPALVTGGVERGAVDVAKALAGAGWRAYVVSAGGPLVRELDRAGVSHIRLPVDSKNPWVMWRNVGRLRRLIASLGIDIVHARSRAPAWSARAAARRSGVPFVTTFHGTYNTGGFLKRRYNAVMAGGDRVIAISDFIADHVASTYGADPSRIVTIPRGIDMRLFDPARTSPERMVKLTTAWRIPDGAPVILLPGRLTRWKGQMVLIEAMAAYMKAGHTWVPPCCLLVGDEQTRSGYRQELEQAIVQRGLGGVVRVAGHCNDMPAAYMLADLVVSASIEPEAFGRVAIEAQAMGRPLLATNIGASRETVRDGITGWLVPPGDPDALAAAIRNVLALRGPARGDFAQAARAHVMARFTVEKMCAATIGVYRELLGTDHGRPG